MTAIDKAVILAAGRGSRLGAVGDGTPKPLLPIDPATPGGGPTFLDWHVRCLAAVGVREIYLVGNRRTVGARVAAVDGVATQWILNPTEDLSCSGSAHSMWLAWTSTHRILDGRSRVVLMDADVVYDPALLHRLADDGDRAHSKLLVATQHQDTGEEVLVFGDPHLPTVPRRLGKGLRGTEAVAGAPCLGEAAGIVLWEPADHVLLAAETDWTMRSSALGTRSEHEDVTQLLMLRDRVRAVRFGAEHSFIEVDSPEDYARLRTEVFPRISRSVLG